MMNSIKFRHILLLIIAIVFIIQKTISSKKSSSQEQIQNISGKIRQSETVSLSEKPIVPTVIQSNTESLDLSDANLFSIEENRLKLTRCIKSLFKIAKSNCDENCLIQFLQKNGARSAFEYIEDGFFRFKGKDISKIKNPKSKLGQFHLALYHADMLDVPNQRTNYSLAKIYLNKLIFEEPTNAAPYLYLAAVEFKQKNFSESKKILEEMKNNSLYFDTYAVEWKRDYQKTRFAIDSALMMELYSLYEHPLRPDNSIFSEMIENMSFDFREVAQLLLQEKVNFEYDFYDRPIWDEQQNDLGLQMLHQSRHYPNWKNNPDRILPTSREIYSMFRKKEEVMGEDVNIIRFELQKALFQNCSFEVYDNWLRKYPLARVYGR